MVLYTLEKSSIALCYGLFFIRACLKGIQTVIQKFTVIGLLLNDAYIEIYKSF